MRPSARAGLRFCRSPLGRRPSLVLRTSFCQKLSRFYIPFWDKISRFGIKISRFGIKLSRFTIPFCFEDDLGCLQAAFGARPDGGESARRQPSLITIVNPQITIVNYYSKLL